MGLLDAPAPSQKSVGLATKRAGFAVSNATATTASFAEATAAMPVKLPVNTTRWRLHLRNGATSVTLSTYTAQALAVAFTGAWVGQHQLSSTTGLGTGGNTATPVQALNSFTTAADGSEYVSGWVTAANAQFTAYTEHLLTLGWTGATTLAYSSGPACWVIAGTGKAALAGTPAPTGIALSAGQGFFDMWVEYEFIGTQPVGLVVGDSRSVSYAASPYTNQMHATWPNLYALLTGYPVLNVSLSGALSSTFGNAYKGNFQVTKWGLGTAIKPDFAIVDLGINDHINPNNWAAATQPSLVGVYAYLKADFAIPRIYATTVMPAGGYLGATYKWVQGTITSGVAAGVTSITTDVAFAAGELLMLDYNDAQTSPQENAIVAAGGSTGTGPYTTPLTAATTQAHSAGATAWNRGEGYRQAQNYWLRNKLPAGLAGVIDIDRVIRSASNSRTLDSEYDDGAHLHLRPAGYRRIAEAMPTRLAIPTL